MQRTEHYIGGILKPISAVLATAALILPGIAKSDTSLCKTTEKVYFSCPMKKKTISLCAPKDKSAPQYLEYRFGQKNKVELNYKVEPKDADRKFYRSEVLYASNSADVIWFKNQSATYLLHFPARGGPMLEVLEKGELVAEMSCNGGWGSVVGDQREPSQFISPGPNSTASDLDQVWGRR